MCFIYSTFFDQPLVMHSDSGLESLGSWPSIINVSLKALNGLHQMLICLMGHQASTLLWPTWQCTL